MTKFQLGDRVQYVGEPSDYDVGTVQVINRYGNGVNDSYRIAFDVSGDVTFDEDELYIVHPVEVKEADMVEHPPHYTGHPKGIECIDVIEENPFPNLANAIKYLWRVSWGSKGRDIEDLKKAGWYIQREIARRENAS